MKREHLQFFQDFTGRFTSGCMSEAWCLRRFFLSFLMTSSNAILRAMRRAEPATPHQLRALTHAWLGLDVTPAPLVKGSSAPLAYFERAVREGSDAVVWAGRGGGKTMLAAAASLLEMIFKPGIQIRVLAGSLEQASKLHEHFTALLDRPLMQRIVADPPTQRRITLSNGSVLSLLAGSQRSVRGVRVHRLRCDEVEELDPELWAAAQLVTRSATVQGRYIPAGLEALSTMHRPAGLMSRLTTPRGEREPAHGSGVPAVFRWTTLDVAGQCPPHYPCTGCPLEPDCQGRAKHASGFVPIDDLIQQRQRTSDSTWSVEIMCQRPSTDDLVYPGFDPDRHVTISPPVDSAAPARLVAGMDFGIRGHAVLLWASISDSSDWQHSSRMMPYAHHQPHLHILDELALQNRTLGQLLEQARQRGHARPDWIAVDPAGNARSSQTALRDTDVVRAAGHTVRFTRTRIHPGIDRVRQRLDHHTLTVHPRCTGLIAALRTYHFPPAPTAGPASSDPVKDGPDHWADALRYLVTNLDTEPRTTTSRSYL